MGDKIFDLISKVATGEKSRFFWAIIIVILITLVIIFPYIDANFLYYSRMEKRLDNLSKLIEISGYSINDSLELEAEYQSILSEISSARERSILGNTIVSESQGTDYWIKFVSGGILFALVGIIGLFSKKKDIKMTFLLFLKNNLTIFIFCGILAMVFSYIFAKVPTLGSVWVNAVLSPIIQLVVVYLIMQPKRKST